MRRIMWAMRRRCHRQFLLYRKGVVSIEDATRRYIHRSAAFATTVCGIGFAGISNYTDMMIVQAAVMRELSRAGPEAIEGLVPDLEALNAEMENVTACISTIRNSVIRYLHTDGEKERNMRACAPKSRRARAPHPQEAGTVESLPVPATVVYHLDNAVPARCDVHE